MTSPQVSEQEVEAVGRAIGAKAVDLAPGKLRVEWPWLYDPDSNTAIDLRELARAALTAAAQVRERAAPTQPNAWLTDIENAPKDGSDVLFPFEFFVSAYWDKDLTRWVLNYPVRYDYVTNPDRYRLPADRPTEPDSGPDVLGEQKE